MPEGPRGGPRPFAESYPIIFAEFEFQRLGAGAFIGEEFEEDKIERRVRNNMTEPEKVKDVETNPDVMQITVKLRPVVKATDLKGVIDVMEDFENAKRVGLDVL